MVVVSDEMDSLAIFNYDVINWSFGDHTILKHAVVSSAGSLFEL